MPHAPPELEAIVNKCLTKDRNGRFQSAAELADALRPFGSDRTRESLDRLHQAKQEPSVNIALNVASEGERIDAEAMSDAAAAQSGLTPPLHPPSSPRTMPGAVAKSPSAPPSSGDPSAAFAHAVKRMPSTTMKLAIAGAGVLIVLLAFGILTVLKMAAQSVGVLPSVNAEPPFQAAPASSVLANGSATTRPAIQLPSTAITVTLDAGRPPP
jgi:serine/threonine-protein kinase